MRNLDAVIFYLLVIGYHLAMSAVNSIFSEGFAQNRVTGVVSKVSFVISFTLHLMYLLYMGDINTINNYLSYS